MHDNKSQVKVYWKDQTDNKKVLVIEAKHISREMKDELMSLFAAKSIGCKVVKEWYGNTFSYKNYSFDALNSLGLR